MKLWSWQMLDDHTAVVEMLHELRGDDTLNSCRSLPVVHQCKGPVAQCVAYGIAYETTLGGSRGWVCTLPPFGEHMLPKGAEPVTFKSDEGEVTTCSRLVFGRWKNAPQVSRSRSSAKIPTTNAKRDKMSSWFRGVCLQAIRDGNAGESNAEVAAWALGKTTSRQITFGEPTAQEVAAFAAFIQSEAREKRPWEKVLT